MDMIAFREMVERRAASYLRLGWDFAEAVNRAVCELLAGGGEGPCGMFCLRACLVGAGREFRMASGHPERN